MRLLQVEYETRNEVGYVICDAVDLPAHELRRYAVLRVSDVPAALLHRTIVDIPFDAPLYTREEYVLGKPFDDMRQSPSAS